MILDFQTCKYCGQEFMPRKFWQKYCKDECRIAAYYIRKAKLTGIDALEADLKSEPTELQEAEWNERTTMRESLEAEKVVREMQRREKPDEPSYLAKHYDPKIVKEESMSALTSKHVSMTTKEPQISLDGKSQAELKYLRAGLLRQREGLEGEKQQELDNLDRK